MTKNTRPAKRRKGWQPTPIIGRYETSGLPVYEGDDYVIDVEGCYLTRAEANELLTELAAQAPALAPFVPPATTPFCARMSACVNPTCQYKIPCDSTTLQPPR
jgi:hypothetical protein